MSKNKKFSSRFESLALSDLNMVIGGAEATGEASTAAGTLKVRYKSDPSPPPPAPDPDAQLRCYKRVADDAHFYDSSNKVLHQQLLLCGPQKH